MLIRKSLSIILLSTLAISMQAQAEEQPQKQIEEQTFDNSGYFVGTYAVDGFDTSVIESYKAKATITSNKGSSLNISIDHDSASGLGTYYGHMSEIDKDTLQLDYWNIARQKHTATCDYHNDGDNFPHFICKGSLFGNIGGDGVFVIHKE